MRSIYEPRGPAWMALAALLSVGGVACGDDGSVPGSDAGTADSCATVLTAECDEALPAGCDALVRAGDTDQATVQGVLIEPPGPTLCFEGAFSFSSELSLTEDGMTLRGTGEGAVWDFAGQSEDDGAGANGLRVSNVDGITIEDLEVRDTAGDGIRVEGSTDVALRRVTMIWSGEPSVENGAYGLYPVECENVLVEESEVVGASDAGIYVGQSEHIVVRNNIAHGNVAGIEIENCANADVFGNEAYDNTGGLLVFDLPDLPAGNGGRIKVHDNLVRENNRENFATVGTIVSFVPPGTGMLVLAADEVEIHENEIRDNQGTGIILFSFQTVEAVGGGSSEDDPSFDPYLETTFIHDNTFLDNGTMPRDLLELVAQGASTLEDIQWDGIVRDGRDASTLCIRNNGEATFRNFDLDPSTLEFGEPRFDLTPHDCAHPALPAVSLDL